MESAIDETSRRREIQRAYNEEHGHEPTTIDKPVSEPNLPGAETDTDGVSGADPSDAGEAARQVDRLEERMREAADNLEFELAASIRDRVRELREDYDLAPDDAGDGVPAPDGG
jgi:excinuclease ABC subunit B